MRLLRFIVLLVVALSVENVSAINLKGKKLDFVCADAQFKNPFIDVDKTITSPTTCRYIHGGFDDGTRFSFYFPLKKEDFTGRFFQYITPMPDSETSAQNYYAANPISFSIVHGAYFIETNEGGAMDVNDPSTRREATIGAYRANAACAELSRYIAKLFYDCDRPFGYCFGGSGGAYRTTGSMEATEGIEVVKEILPEDSTIWCASIDKGMNEQKYIVPGFGDCGDLCYGEKLQSFRKIADKK